MNELLQYQSRSRQRRPLAIFLKILLQSWSSAWCRSVCANAQDHRRVRNAGGFVTPSELWFCVYEGGRRERDYKLQVAGIAGIAGCRLQVDLRLR
jgi:hypothetical protein